VRIGIDLPVALQNDLHGGQRPVLTPFVIGLIICLPINILNPARCIMTRPGNHPFRSSHATSPTLAKWCIWSVANQSWLAGQIRIYIWGAVAVLAVFILTGFISPRTALTSMFISGAIIAVTIWLLIRQRRIWLLHIQDSELRRQALAAMVTYLNDIHYPLPRQLHNDSILNDDPDDEADYGHIR
jgi:hypothetical protein